MTATDEAFDYYSKGVEAMSQNDLEKAKHFLELSNRHMPHYKTFERLGHILRILGQIVAAEDAFRTAFHLNNKSDRTGIRYAEVLLQVGKVPEAKAVVDGVLLRNASYGPARELLRRLAAMKGQDNTKGAG